MKIITLAALKKLLDKQSYNEFHVHHTWKPTHKDFKGNNHLALQESMKNYHVNTNGWADIAQHITVFPDGKIMTGRGFDKTPVSISGYNTKSFMMEMIGNFDIEGKSGANTSGYDKLEGKQLNTVVEIAKYFNSRGCYIRFHNENSSKTCPGNGVDKATFMGLVRKGDNMLKYTKPVKRGAKGNHVAEVQTALNTLGYNCGAVDGSCGPATETAIRNFQRANGLVVDGSFGPASYAKINTLMGTKTPPNGGYQKIRKFNSDVHVYDAADNIVDVDLGVRKKLEKVSTVVNARLKEGKEVLAAINLGFFNFDASSEHLGMYIDEGLYYTSPSNSFIDFIYYKNGTTKIENMHGYDAYKLSQLQRDSNWSIGTSYSLVQKGKINLENKEKFSHYKNREPRTLLGQKKDGSFILVVVDGRRLSSAGVTAQQSAEIMLELGCINAINCDGGGSSTLVIVDNGKAKVANRPSNTGGAERAVGSMLIVYKK